MGNIIQPKESKQRNFLNSEKIKSYYSLIIALILIVVYFILRKIKKEEIEREEKENATLKEILALRINKKEKLEKKVLSYYRRTKWLFALVLIATIGFFIYYSCLDTVLNYINLIAIVVFILSVAAFDRPGEIIDLLKFLKSQIENYVYRNDKDIHFEIEKLKSLVADKEQRIEELKNDELTDLEAQQILEDLNEKF